MKFIAVALALLPAFIVAQSTTDTAAGAVPTSLSGVDPCVLNCSEVAAVQAGCGTVTNTTCVCVLGGAFQSAALSCLESNCNATEIAEATGLQSELCGAVSNSSATGSAATAASSAASAVSTASVSGSAIGSSAAAAMSSGSASAASAASSGSVAATSKSAGIRIDLVSGMGGLAGVVVVLFGLALGTTLVL